MRHAQATCAMISHQRWPMTNMNLLLRFPLGVDPATSNFSPKCWGCFPLLVSSKHFFNFGPWFLLSTISKNTSGCPVKFKIQDGRPRKTAVGLWVFNDVLWDKNCFRWLQDGTRAGTCTTKKGLKRIRNNNFVGKQNQMKPSAGSHRRRCII